MVVVLAWDLEDHAPLSLVWVTGLDLHQGLSEGCQWLECSLDTKWGADLFQLFTEPSDVGEARDREGVITCRFWEGVCGIAPSSPSKWGNHWL